MVLYLHHEPYSPAICTCLILLTPLSPDRNRRTCLTTQCILPSSGLKQNTRVILLWLIQSHSITGILCDCDMCCRSIEERWCLWWESRAIPMTEMQWWLPMCMAVRWGTSRKSWQPQWHTLWTTTWPGWKGNVVSSLFLSNLLSMLLILIATDLVCVWSLNRVVPFGNTNKFTMPVILTFWGKEENREAVNNQMTRYGFRLGTDLKGFFVFLQCMHDIYGSHLFIHYLMFFVNT